MAKFNKEKNCIELGCDDVFEVSSKIADLVSEMTKEHDKFLYECFAKYGFTKEWLLDPAHFRYVRIDRYRYPGGGSYIDTVSVYGHYLFQLSTVVDDTSIGYAMRPMADPIEIKKRLGTITNMIKSREPRRDIFGIV